MMVVVLVKKNVQLLKISAIERSVLSLHFHAKARQAGSCTALMVPAVLCMDAYLQILLDVPLNFQIFRVLVREICNVLINPTAVVAVVKMAIVSLCSMHIA